MAVVKRRSMIGGRTFPVLRSTYSWRVTTYVRYRLANQANSAFHPLMRSRLQLDGRHHQSEAAPSGERLRGKVRHGVVCR